MTKQTRKYKEKLKEEEMKRKSVTNKTQQNKGEEEAGAGESKRGGAGEVWMCMDWVLDWPGFSWVGLLLGWAYVRLGLVPVVGIVQQFSPLKLTQKRRGLCR